MKPTAADKYLIDRIRSGDQGAWSQLIDRFRGRLVSFARAKLPQRADAEDVVQETFIAFIKSLPAFRQESPVESYLFAILRRKISDTYRSPHSRHITLIQDVYAKGASEDSPSNPFSNLASEELTASSYVGRDEDRSAQLASLGEALNALVKNHKANLSFRELQIVELLFYSQLSNSNIAKVMDISQQHIAVIKHRCIKQVRGYIQKCDLPSLGESGIESMLTEVWESARPSCPKRSTIGAYLLETLEKPWAQYVDFHLNKLGCHFCRANLQDLQEQTKEDKTAQIHNRIMESTIGFLHKP
ncbi:MAG: sigma-70 family RNA polymerase sigma factor [Planctomycetes bacterium]|nr:sigma-70 family RNA polymerase sigma factor [Planctomycetota bacterium]